MTAPAQIVGVDLFCGAGGLTYGLARGGIDIRAGIDVDPACKYPFEKNNSSKFIEKDIQDVSVADIGPFFEDAEVTLLAGCAPCQPFSTYSRKGRSERRGLDWKLVESFGRLIDESGPDLVTMENVPQLGDHPVFEDFLEHLKDFSIAWSVVECSSIGVPQSRRRLVLVASRLGDVHLDLSPNDPMKRTVRDEISDLPRIAAGESDPSDRLHLASRLSPLNLRRIRESRPGGTWRDWESSLQATCHRKKSGETYPSVYGRMEWDKEAPTITTQCFGYGNGRFGHPEQDRAISLREAAMLQTFPRDYAFVAPEDPVRFNRLGRLIGNAVPVRLAEKIADILVQHVESAGTPDKAI